jgi:uncharacterized protein
MDRPLLTRRRFVGRFLIGASVVAAVGGADALYLEPRNLVAERIDVRLKRLPAGFHGFRIAQMTGDFVSHPFGGWNGAAGARYAEPCADVLANIKGVPTVAILGNHDHWNNAHIVEGALKDRGIEALRNRALPLERGVNRIWISGIDDALVGAADLRLALHEVPSSEATILLAHEPDFADYAARFPIDLQLSGHSHGGQVRVPGLGALILPALARKYPAGLYQVGPLQVYTNRGIGVINPPVRFNCPPRGDVSDPV